MKQSIPRLRSVQWKSGGYLRVVPRDTDVGQRVCVSLEKACGHSIECLSETMRGYALVVWDKRGHIRTTVREGSVGFGSIPTFVQSALQTHVATVLAQDAAATHLPDDDGAV